MIVCWVYSLESPRWDDSNEYILQCLDDIRQIIKYLFSCAIGRILKGLKKEFESSTVNEPSVFEPLMLYYIMPPHIMQTVRWLYGCSSHLNHFGSYKRRFYLATVPNNMAYHYENMPIQIYWKSDHQKMKIFRWKILIYFIFLFKT